MRMDKSHRPLTQARPAACLTALWLCLPLTPLQAQTPPAPTPPVEMAPSEMEEGLGLLERGMRLLMEGFFAEMKPSLEGLGEALEGLEPLMAQMAALIGDIRHYEAPERLPNGDIILRRKADAPPMPDLPEPAAKPPVDGIEL